ncbi:tetratricopeptide repeat protein [Corallococcus macrosporus]|uniref:TPR repeat-containing protein n=1 Tax=Myxococcus fulvus (strain ATCC BAA-855 / HW-1) TaxID=483219 RepID=F8CGC6_MYXFH|nr:tetratricopeptide repeat protein [Corallococcus macrosporus]AEI68661.1 TPR repeat-containing protein [Corallococcus macrosporus]
MRQDTPKKPTLLAGLPVPTALRRALVPVGIVALGLVAAWADAPLPPALTTWLDAEQQAAPEATGPRIVIDVSAPDSGTGGTRGVRATPREVHRAPASAGLGAVPGAEDSRGAPPDNDTAPDTSAEPGAGGLGSEPDATLALPHTHGRRVDHLSRAHLLRDWDDLSGALTECRRAIHDAPEDVAAVALAAELAGLTGRLDLAVRAQAWLGRLLPLDARPLVRQARLLVSLGRHTEAVEAGEEAVVRDPEYVEAYQVLGRAHLASGELAKAMLRFQQAVHLHPEHGYALNNLGLTYLRAGENQKAADVLTRAAALLPHVAYVHNNLGVAHERLGQQEHARSAYAAAMHLSPRYVQARVNADRMRRMAHADIAGAQPQRGQARPTGGEASAPR